ncbi:transporter [Roseovarius sp. A46]|uniref:TolC family outer membrane protein n=1 Tax=Roseovarius sp. A46 TaxID=2109331 RepID=UPI001010CC5B|nr:TolC family outer membrane protein [Roseovarius sp. A46]RXV59042.1 transporter [Roseovarius sp. A46]
MLKADVTKSLRVLLMCLAGLFPATGSHAETLADTLESAYRNSGLLEQNRALLRAADEDVASAISRLRPILRWSSRVSYVYDEGQDSFGRDFDTDQGDLSVGLTAEWLLYDFGRSAFRTEATKETVLATRQRLRSIEQEVLFRAVQAHANVIRTQNIVNLRRNNLSVIRRELNAAENRFRIGEITETDVFQAEARLASAESGLTAAERELEFARDAYKVAVGREPGRLKPISQMPDPDMTEQAAKSIALSSHPTIQEIQHQIKAADLAAEAARKELLPTINLFGEVNIEEEITSGTDFGRRGQVGVEMSGPIYQGGGLNAAIRKAIAQRDAARGELISASRQVEQRVGNAFARMQAAQLTLKSSRDEVKASELSFEGVKNEARFGSRTTLDILQSEQILLNARIVQVEAQIDLQLSSYNILASIGQLTVEDLNLDVTTYDPAAYYKLVKDAPSSLSAQGRKLDRVLEALGK